MEIGKSILLDINSKAIWEISFVTNSIQKKREGSVPADMYAHATLFSAKILATYRGPDAVGFPTDGGNVNFANKNEQGLIGSLMCEIERTLKDMDFNELRAYEEENPEEKEPKELMALYSELSDKISKVTGRASQWTNIVDVITDGFYEVVGSSGAEYGQELLITVTFNVLRA